jgi:hypothetical protein
MNLRIKNVFSQKEIKKKIFNKEVKNTNTLQYHNKNDFKTKSQTIDGERYEEYFDYYYTATRWK